MNTNDKNHGDTRRTDPTQTTIRNDASSKDASSGKSSSGRGPQQGSAIDNTTTARDASRSGPGKDGSAKR